MTKAIIVLLIAIIMFAISYVAKSSYKKRNAKYTQQTDATINKVVFSDTGNAMYYVSFCYKGSIYSAQTEYYSSETPTINPGEKVKIRYFFTKHGNPLAIILDDCVVPVDNSIPGLVKFTAVVGIALAVIAIFMFFATNL